MTTPFENRKTTAYENGRIAAKQGYNITDNPHEHHNLTRLDWNRGFRDEAAGKPQVSIQRNHPAHPKPYTPAEKDEAASTIREDGDLLTFLHKMTPARKQGFAAYIQGEPREEPPFDLGQGETWRHNWLSGWDLAKASDMFRQDRVVSLEGERPFSMADFLEAVGFVVRERGL